MRDKPRIVALEEHYIDPDLAPLLYGTRHDDLSEMERRLLDLGTLRLREMDDAGIDLQVLSHGAPGCQQLDPETAVRMSRQTNDRLHLVVQGNPARFAAFGILPTPDPAAAADELERVVTRLGFKGAMLHGLTHGRFIDDKQFWPIFERAEALDVPLYLHPAYPSPAVAEVYYNDYAREFPELLGPALGFTVETATQGVRLVLSGVFEKYPRLKFIIGHLGEGLPFLLWRINQSLSRPGNSRMAFRDIFCKHFWLTTSGNFSDSALACAITEMGVDRILFSVDWPYVDNRLGTQWLSGYSLTEEDKSKIFAGNAASLLKL
ncbi:amidohydrolase family protein [Bradyrhizobium sp. dw_411]|uniref:amidohydrolase family protein n=1 Tax=Bradyrhizobium sp. dw_411 TaxID=2720082 RepID=UPI001BCF0314|nr:amidohydrolase family protein [Bradyrhizobium sp. dw_411]